MQVLDEIVIQIINMNKWYGQFYVFCDINLIVNCGEWIVIVGFLGLGKLIMICCINWFEEYQVGQIIVDGIELMLDLKNIDKIWLEVGMCFQYFNLFLYLIILENCILVLIWVCKMFKCEVEEIVMYFFEKVKIFDQVLKYFGQFFGGQQQCVVIVCLLCMKLCIMLFDELILVLDLEMIKEVFDIMIELVEEGMIMLCVIYEMGFVQVVVNCVIFMD